MAPTSGLLKLIVNAPMMLASESPSDSSSCPIAKDFFILGSSLDLGLGSVVLVDMSPAIIFSVPLSHSASAAAAAAKDSSMSTGSSDSMENASEPSLSAASASSGAVFSSVLSVCDTAREAFRRSTERFVEVETQPSLSASSASFCKATSQAFGSAVWNSASVFSSCGSTEQPFRRSTTRLGEVDTQPSLSASSAPFRTATSQVLGSTA
mmetsp:Transcript_120155/g.340087  ORF Transcript_120155/g.340087 Transcript_120155/m.340087 type:complete len:209 (-) Transcript_120155:2300-2926(-)